MATADRDGRGTVPKRVVSRWLARWPGVGTAVALLAVAAAACGGGATAAVGAASGPSGQPGSLATGAAATRTHAAQTQAAAATQTRAAQVAAGTQAQAVATQTRAAQAQVAAATQTRPAQGQVATGGQGPATAATQTRAAQLQAVGLPASGPAQPAVTPTLSAQAQALRDCYFLNGQNQGVALKEDCVSAQARQQAARDCQEFADAAGCASQWARYVQAALDHQLRMPAQLCFIPAARGEINGFPAPDAKPGDTCDTGKAVGRVAAVVRN